MKSSHSPGSKTISAMGSSSVSNSLTLTAAAIALECISTGCLRNIVVIHVHHSEAPWAERPRQRLFDDPSIMGTPVFVRHSSAFACHPAPPRLAPWFKVVRASASKAARVMAMRISSRWRE
jgi:hypothetical protein